MKGSSGNNRRSTYSGRKLPASSRETPSVVWVRSFVPNEKNSASTASWSATMAARGSSIMVPNLNRRSSSQRILWRTAGISPSGKRPVDM